MIERHCVLESVRMDDEERFDRSYWRVTSRRVE